MGFPRTPVNENKIIKWYTKDRLSGKVIAQRLGVSYGKIYRVLKENNIPIKRVPSIKRETSDLEKQKSRTINLKRFKLTPEDYDRILLGQNGACAICGTTQCREGFLFCVDHDHRTGTVRGLLCTSCNLLLGLARDSKKTLRSAIRYLNNSQRRQLI